MAITSISTLFISMLFIPLLSLSLFSWTEALSAHLHPLEIQHIDPWIQELTTIQRVEMQSFVKMKPWREEFVYQGRRLFAINTSANEIKALLAFKSAINLDPTNALVNWTEENNFTCCSTWKGVVCDKVGQVIGIDLGNVTLNGTITPLIGNLMHLTSLNLSGSRIYKPWRQSEYDNNMVAPFPLGLGSLSGQIPLELIKCKNLTILDLSFNSLDGESLQELFTLPKLEFLRLSFNNFPRPITLPEVPKNACQSLTNLRISDANIGGVIPSSLSRCQNLKVIVLGFNQLNGTIPTSLTQLHQLQLLSLEHNNLTGWIPSQMGSLKNLVRLSLFENKLEGHIPPSIGMLSQLQALGLHQNKLTGTIPSSLGNLTSIWTLGLGNNKLRGIIPHSFGNLCHLEALELNNLKLTGTIPPSLGNCLKLRYLWLGSNATGYNDLRGTIPQEIGNLNFLKGLYLENNKKLTGPIPKSLSKCSNLQGLFLGGCGFTSIPIELWSIKELQHVLIFQNNLSGTLSSKVGNCIHLTSLDLSSNMLTGPISSSLNMLKNLTTLILHSNMFTGKVPLLTECQKLRTFRLEQNKLEGPLQLDFNKWPTLEYFSISNNNLSGEVSSFFPNTNSSLIFLDFSQNKFSSRFPSQINSTYLSNLRVLMFSHNQLQGPIPSWFGNLKSLQVLDLSYNKLNGSIPQSFYNLNGYKVKSYSKVSFSMAPFVLNASIDLAIKSDTPRAKYTYILSTTTYMDLSSNALNGIIPLGITNLYALKYLLLSNNKIEGVIWDAFANLEELETLDLSQNNLNGPIPLQLPSSLSTFNVSLNNLSGAIPIGGQYDTFNISSYLPGNLELCGNVIHRPCIDVQIVYPNNNVVGRKHGILDFISIPAFDVGLVSGFSIVMMILLFWGPTRIPIFMTTYKENIGSNVALQDKNYGAFTYPS